MVWKTAMPSCEYCHCGVGWFVCLFVCNSAFFPHGFLPARKLERQLLVKVTPYSFKRDNCHENFMVILILVRTKDKVQHLNMQSSQEIVVKK